VQRKEFYEYIIRKIEGESAHDEDEDWGHSEARGVTTPSGEEEGQEGEQFLFSNMGADWSYELGGNDLTLFPDIAIQNFEHL
jgi:hypothetical protein